MKNTILVLLAMLASSLNANPITPNGKIFVNGLEPDSYVLVRLGANEYLQLYNCRIESIESSDVSSPNTYQLGCGDDIMYNVTKTDYMSTIYINDLSQFNCDMSNFTFASVTEFTMDIDCREYVALP